MKRTPLYEAHRVLGARDTLRLEMGYPLDGHELSEDRTPVGAGRGWYLDLTKDFIGRTAVARELEQGPAQVLVGLRLETRRAARAQDTVFLNGRAVGHVSSGSLSPSLGVAIALAYVDTALSAVGMTLDVRSRGDLLKAVVVDLPFYRKGTAREKRMVRDGAGAWDGPVSESEPQALTRAGPETLT